MIDLHTLARQTKYSPQAFAFVQQGLDFAIKRIHGEPDATADPMSRHISGGQLCTGLRQYAIERYGLMALSVLNSWQVRSCEDFGHIVFAMVDSGILHKTENDSLEDFRGLFDFDEAFASGLKLTENN